MSNNNDISVQKSVAYTLQHPDGSEVTAQEVYDAFMSGQVMLFDVSNGVYWIPTSFYWVDANCSKDDPTNVVYAEVRYIYSTGSLVSITIGFPPK